MLEQPLVFTGSSSIQFFNSPTFPNTVIWATFSTLPLTVQQPYDLQSVMMRHLLPGLPTQTLPIKAKDFLSGYKTPKGNTLPKYLAYVELEVISW